MSSSNPMRCSNRAVRLKWSTEAVLPKGKVLEMNPDASLAPGRFKAKTDNLRSSGEMANCLYADFRSTVLVCRIGFFMSTSFHHGFTSRASLSPSSNSKSKNWQCKQCLTKQHAIHTVSSKAFKCIFSRYAKEELKPDSEKSSMARSLLRCITPKRLTGFQMPLNIHSSSLNE